MVEVRLIGIAIQIQDDVLNLIGDTDRYGKEALGDLLEGKRTVMMIHLFRHASPAVIKRITAINAKPRSRKTQAHAEEMLAASKAALPVEAAVCVAAVADALNIQTFAVSGEAVGAATTIALAVDYPQRVSHVVLLNCPYYANRKAADNAHGPLKSGLRPEDSSGFPLTRTLEFLLEKDPGHSPVHPTQSWMDRINTAQMECGRHRWQALDALHGYDIGANLQKVQCPILLLIGEHFHYLQYRDEFHNKNNKLRSAVIQGARLCMGWERAVDVGRHTREFLQAPA